MGDSQVPSSRERLDRIALDSRMFIDYLQGFFTPEILNRIHILGLGGQVQRPGAVLGQNFWHFHFITSLTP